MEVHEALYTTRMMRRMRPDPVPMAVQCRILDAAIRAPSAGNAQPWHFLVLDDAALKARIAELYREIREDEFSVVTAGQVGGTLHEDDAVRTGRVSRLRRSGDHFVAHLAESPLLVLVFSVDDHGGASVFPAVWSALLAARAEGVGGVLTTGLRFREAAVRELLGVPGDEGWKLTAMLAFGYPLGRWGVAADRRPVHEVSSRNRWGADFGARVTEPLWPAAGSAIRG